MRQLQQIFAFTAYLCSVVIMLVSAVPLPANNQELDVLQIPLSDGKELDVLTLSARDQEQLIAERNKRTIGLLRELFPDITKEIDGIVNRIIGQVIRVAGPSLLPALLGNNRPTTEASDFDADFEDDDDSSSNDVNPKPVESVFSKTEGNTGTSDDASRVNIGLPTFAPESGEVTPTTTAEPIKKVSSGQVGGEKATTDITTTSTTTAAATMKPTTTTSGTTMPQTTTVIPTTTTAPTTTTTSTTSKPIPIPTIPTTTSTTTAASPTTIPTSTTTTTIPTSTTKTTTPTPITTTTSSTPITTTTIPPPITTTTAPSTTIPTTTVNSILVLTTNKGPSRGATNRNKNNNTPNVTTQQPTTIDNETKSSSNTTPAISIDLPTYPPTISDILKPTTTETLPTPSIPATYLGTFDSGLEEPQLQKPSTRSLTQKEQQQLQLELQQKQSQINSLPFAVDVDRTQLVALIDNINRLLNSTNFFIDNRNNTNSPQFTTTTITNKITTTTTPSIAVPTTSLMPTANITKLLPNGATDTQIDLSAINKQLEETIRVARQVKEAEAAAQQQQQQSQSAAPAQIPIPSKTDANAPVQLSFSNEATPLSTAPDNSKPVNNDLRSTDSKSPAIDELTLDSNEDAADLDDRNKRFLSFGGAGVAGGSGGNAAGGNAAAGGGSGNFLFDIIRLFSGSVQTQTGDEAANSANSVSADGDVGGYGDANRAADGFTEGIPGPVTRLVVLANRGLANLIQDLILRIAATSEKFVNFKAKLITALI